ncbi:MAG: hypothetical protein ACP5K5_00465 [Candidatus Micrarchaeia archaeon]
MRGYRIFYIAVIFLLLASVADAQYWFQTGARGTNSAAFNNGAKVSIESISQNISYGSMAFWIGEDLSNGAFVQVGYEVVNSSGNYPTYCNLSGCYNYTFQEAGMPIWFWEYFPAGYHGSSFLGGTGGSDSAGPLGTFHTYAFNSTGNVWNFYFDNKLIGSVDLGTSTSGPNPPVAMGEYAGAITNSVHMNPVKFQNLEFYTNGAYKLVPEGYSYIGYGTGSETVLPNLYGVSEIGNLVNYFEVGSGIPLNNHTTLWKLGYILRINSQYGNATGVWNYSAYSSVQISVPRYVYIGNGERAAFVGWVGSGAGSYTGNSTNATIFMNSNITENAKWQIQYLVNVTNSYGLAVGGGWYANNSIAQLGLESTVFNSGAGTRLAFEGWSNGNKNANFSIVVNSPMNFSPLWQKQYLVNVSTEYGSALGSGWYNASSKAVISLSEPNATVTSYEKESFYEWSNGSRELPLEFTVEKPVFITAIYAPRYLINFSYVDAYNRSIYAKIGIDNANYTTNAYLFNGTYNIQYAVYKNTTMGINQHFAVSGAGTVIVKLPVYNIEIKTLSLFGIPTNASFYVTFKNGTSVEGNTGSNGTATFSDVPYGYAMGYVTKLGIKQHFATSNGTPAEIRMLTPSLFAAIIIGIAIIIAVERTAAFVEKKREAKKR